MALVIGVVLGVVRRSDRRELVRSVGWGILAGVAASIVVAILFQRLAGGFAGRAEQLFEGIMMLVGSALVTFTIAWAARDGHRGALEKQATARLAGAAAASIFFLVFLSILREGTELVVFLGASQLVGPESELAGVALGLAAAAVLGLVLNVVARSGLRVFFTATTALLVLFAAGLLSRGLGELSEAGVLPPIVQRLWDINPLPHPDGSLPAMHEEGAVGGILRSLFGYTGAPSALELIGWAGYLVGFGAAAAARRARAGAPARH